MQNNIPEKTLEKIFDLIQKRGVDDEKVLGVHKFFDPKAAEKFIQVYIKRGVVGDLDLRRTSVEKLPEGLRCRKLYLEGNKTLDHLPKVEAEGIWAGFTNIQKIDKGLKCGLLDLSGNKVLKHLPQMEAEKIRAEYTNIQTIGEGLKVKILELEENKTLKHLPKMEAERITATYTNIETIAEGLKCRKLNLSRNKALKEFPRNLQIGELDLANTYFSENYTKEEIRKKIEIEGGGKVGQILM